MMYLFLIIKGNLKDFHPCIFNKSSLLIFESIAYINIGQISNCLCHIILCTFPYTMYQLQMTRYESTCLFILKICLGSHFSFKILPTRVFIFDNIIEYISKNVLYIKKNNVQCVAAHSS